LAEILAKFDFQDFARKLSNIYVIQPRESHLTYVAGFLTDHGIYLTVDSASTGGVETAIHSDTFFGEPAVHDSYAISDNAMKLFQISSHRLVAAAGDYEKIHQSIQFLRENSHLLESPSELFRILQLSLQLPNNSISLVFAEHNEKGFEMGIWRSGDEYVKPTNSEGMSPFAICTGSGRVFSYLTENIGKAIRLVTDATIPNNLAFISCCHQLHGVHANHVLKNVGGAFITAVLTKKGVVWQPDITYFRYSPSIMKKKRQGKDKLTMFYPVNVMVREGAVFVERRVPEYRAIYMDNAVNKAQSAEIKNKHEEEVNKTALNLSCEYGAFLSSDDPYAILIHHFKDDYYYKNDIEKNTANISFSEDIYAKLIEKPLLNNMHGAMNIFCLPENFIKPNYKIPVL